MILKKTLTKNLSRNHIKLINLLKNTHWKYSIKKQNEWFDLNAHKDDLHLMVFIKKEEESNVRKKKVLLDGSSIAFRSEFDELIFKFSQSLINTILIDFKKTDLFKYIRRFLVCSISM